MTRDHILWTEWSFYAKPVKGAPLKGSGPDLSGWAVYLTDGEEDFEVQRVAYAREHTAFPDKLFGDALREVAEKAEAACKVANELLEKDNERRAQALYDARDRVRELLGEPAGEPV